MGSKSLLFISFLFHLSLCVRAGDFYVSPGGSDDPTVTGLSAADAFASVSYAAERLSTISGKHTIYVSEGSYLETRRIRLNPGINVSGAGIGVTVIQTGIDSVLFDLSQEFWCEPAVNSCTWKWKNNHEGYGDQRISGMTLEHVQDTCKKAQGIIVKGRHNVVLEHLEVKNFRLNGVTVFAKDVPQGINLEPEFYLKNFRLSHSSLINCGAKSGDSDYRTSALQIGNLDSADISNLTIYTDPILPDSMIGFGVGFAYFGWFKAMKFHDCSIIVGPIKKEPGEGNNFAFVLINFLKGNEFYNIQTNGAFSLQNSQKADSLSNSGNLKIYRNQFKGETDPKFSRFELAPLLSGVEIYDNYFYNMNKQSLLFMHTNPNVYQLKRENITIHHNVFENPECPEDPDASRGIVIKGGEILDMRVYNNLFYKISRPVYIEPDSVSSVSGLRILNNQFIKTCDKPFTILNLEERSVSGIEISNNLFEQSPNPYEFQNLGGPTAENVIFTGNTGNHEEDNYSLLSLSGNLFSDYFRTLCNSPVIDAGIDVGLPYTGQAPDIGPFENDCIYPVSLVSFEGKILADNTIQLSWKVNNERFIKGYHIEESNDGLTYAEIGFVSADSVFRPVQEYVFVDSAIQKNNYFRLRQETEKDSISFCGPVFIGLPDKLDVSFVYPVPAYDKVNFSIGTDEPADVKIELFDVTGRMLYHSEDYLKKGYNFFSLDVSHLKPGCYYVGVYSITGKYFVSKQLLIGE